MSEHLGAAVPAEQNRETDEVLVAGFHRGDSEACEKLLIKYRELVKTISKKYYIAGADNEDVIQEGTIGLFKAIRDYRANGGSSFRSFAGLCIERQIQTAVSGANREKHKILTESLSLEEDETETGVLARAEAQGSISGSAEDAADPEELTLMKETIERVMELSERVLSPMESEVFKHLIRGEGYQEIASKLGKSPKSIDNAIQRLKKKIEF